MKLARTRRPVSPSEVNLATDEGVSGAVRHSSAKDKNNLAHVGFQGRGAVNDDPTFSNPQ